MTKQEHYHIGETVYCMVENEIISFLIHEISNTDSGIMYAAKNDEFYYAHQCFKSKEELIRKQIAFWQEKLI